MLSSSLDPGSTMRSVGQDSSKKPPRPGHGPGPVVSPGTSDLAPEIGIAFVR